MRCIFVLDILNGAVVHAVRGERSGYEPIERHSIVVSCSDPLRVLDQVRPKEAYVADLDRLMGRGDNLRSIEEISRRTSLMADIGVSDLSHLRLLPVRAIPVIGTETASLDLISKASRARDVVVSLDMKRHEVLAGDPSLVTEPLELLRLLNDLTLESIIILELDRVGTSSGLDREFLERAAEISDHSLILGGGVKGMGDLEALEDMGFGGALVATAVHNGRVPLERMR